MAKRKKGETADRVEEEFQAVTDDEEGQGVIPDEVFREVGPSLATEAGPMVSTLADRRQCGCSRRCSPAE